MQFHFMSPADRFNISQICSRVETEFHEHAAYTLSHSCRLMEGGKIAEKSSACGTKIERAPPARSAHNAAMLCCTLCGMISMPRFFLRTRQTRRGDARCTTRVHPVAWRTHTHNTVCSMRSCIKYELPALSKCVFAKYARAYTCPTLAQMV